MRNLSIRDSLILNVEFFTDFMQSEQKKNAK